MAGCCAGRHFAILQGMEITVHFKQMSVSEAVRTFAEEKSQRLARYFHGNTAISWDFRTEHGTHHAHLHLVGVNMDYSSVGESADMRGAVDEALSRMETQLRKFKEIVTDHHRADGAHFKALNAEAVSEPNDETDTESTG